MRTKILKFKKLQSKISQLLNEILILFRRFLNDYLQKASSEGRFYTKNAYIVVMWIKGWAFLWLCR